MPGAVIRFGAFRVDVANEMLHRGDTPLSLTPKAYGVLMHLIEHAGTLVTKRMLLDAVWPEAIVGDAVLKVAVREVRKRLGDDSRDPSFIQTAHRRGYRFIHEIDRSEGTPPPAPVSLRTPPRSDRVLVERADALEVLERAWEDARGGRQRIVFVDGTAGSGKSTLVDGFVDGLVEGAPLMVRGDYVPVSGDVEDFAGLLDAFGRALQGPHGEAIKDVMRRYAPASLLRIPWAVTDDERQKLREAALGASETTIRRELADLLEALSRRSPLLLTMDDIQWADAPSLDVLSLLARRGNGAILVVASLRPEDAPIALERLAADVVARSEGERITLSSLSRSGIAQFLEKRLGLVDDALIDFVHRRSEGLPLFAVNLLADLVQRAEVVERDGRQCLVEGADIEHRVPDNLENLIRARVDRFSESERSALEAASVASVMGSPFSAVSVGAALKADVAELEDLFENVWRTRGFLRQEEPLRFEDGVVTMSWAFAHGLYGTVIYDGLSEMRRIQYHRRIVRLGVEILASRRDEFAHEIAFHFERAGETASAVAWWGRAAAVATSEFRHRDAARMAARALSLPGEEGSDDRLSLRELLGVAHRATGDFAAAGQEFERLRREAVVATHAAKEVEACLLIASVRFWSDPAAALAAVDEAVALAERTSDDVLRHHAAGYRGHLVLNLVGSDDSAARACDEAVQTMRENADQRRLAFHLTRSVWLDCCRGRYDAAVAAAGEAASLNLEIGNAFDYLLTMFWWSWAELHAGRWGEASRVIDEGLSLSDRSAHRSWACLFAILKAQLLCDVGLTEEACDLCGAAVAAGAEVGEGAGQIRDHGAIVQGLAAARVGDTDRAHELVQAVEERLADAPSALDRILLLPLLRVRCLVSSAREDGTLAAAAGELVERAEELGESGYAELGRAFAARAQSTPFVPGDVVVSPFIEVLTLEAAGGSAEERARAHEAIGDSLADWPDLESAWRAS